MTTEAKLQEQEHRNNNNNTKYRVPVAKKSQQEHTQQRGRGCRSLQNETPQSTKQGLRRLKAQNTAGFYNTFYP